MAEPYLVPDRVEECERCGTTAYTTDQGECITTDWTWEGPYLVHTDCKWVCPECYEAYMKGDDLWP